MKNKPLHRRNRVIIYLLIFVLIVFLGFLAFRHYNAPPTNPDPHESEASISTGSASPDTATQGQTHTDAPDGMPTADNLFGTWVFHDTLTTTITGIYSVNFTSDYEMAGEDIVLYHAMQVEEHWGDTQSDPMALSWYFIDSWDSMEVSITPYQNDNWINLPCKVIDFGSEGQSVPAEFFNWLTENADYQEP